MGRLKTVGSFTSQYWHGAAKDSWFVHIAVEIPGENASTEWHEPVDIKDYNKLK